jgi:hypothetical protein
MVILEQNFKFYEKKTVSMKLLKCLLGFVVDHVIVGHDDDGCEGGGGKTNLDLTILQNQPI